MRFYAMIDGEQKGPFSLEELADAGVRPSTFVWCKGMPEWERAEDNADICRYWRNRLYDIMHPSRQNNLLSTQGGNAIPPFSGTKPASSDTSTPPPFPTRYDRYLGDTPNQLPSLEEIDEKQNTDVPPSSMLPWSILATVFFFPPGIVAIYFAIKSKSAWKAGANKEAHDLTRSAKMWTGITFFLGMIFYAALTRFA